jgi:hypothetical protein
LALVLPRKLPVSAFFTPTQSHHIEHNPRFSRNFFDNNNTENLGAFFASQKTGLSGAPRFRVPAPAWDETPRKARFSAHPKMRPSKVLSESQIITD